MRACCFFVARNSHQKASFQLLIRKNNHAIWTKTIIRYGHEKLFKKKMACVKFELTYGLHSNLNKDGTHFSALVELSELDGTTTWYTLHVYGELLQDPSGLVSHIHVRMITALRVGDALKYAFVVATY